MKYFDAAMPHDRVISVYLDGELVKAAAADSEAGWVDLLVMNEGYVMKDYTGRPQTVRRYGDVRITSFESERLELMLQVFAA